MIKMVMAQINTSVGDFHDNRNRIHLALMFAQSRSADMVVFPECTTTGYPQKDLLYNDAFITNNMILVADILEQTKLFRGITAVVGCVQKTPNGLFNSACVIRDGLKQGIYNKHLLPNYNVFDERRYFRPGTDSPIFKVGDYVFGITICEDIWSEEYNENPIEQYKGRVDFVVNLSASPFDSDKIERRKKILINRSLETNLPIAYINMVGAQDNLIFDGASMFANGNEVTLVAPQFKESFDIVEFDGKKFRSLEKPVDELSNIEQIKEALILGVKDYFRKTGFKRALLGLSGGIDSAVVCSIAVEALGADNVLGVLMPSQYSSGGSIGDALLLANSLGIKTVQIPIKDVLEQFNKKIIPAVGGKYREDVTEQNLQARIRGTILMALSNDEGRMLLSTGNKSEMSCGYCTIYGDMCGGLSVISDVYKTTVYKLARVLPGIPESSIIKPPSAELKPDQKDTDSLPPYDVLDGILKQYIERKKSFDDILNKGFDPTIVRRVIRMVDRAEYKRRQAAPGLIISERDLAVGRRMPIANKFESFVRDLNIERPTVLMPKSKTV